jgi:ribosomal-protein-alanine N-acetyltransferase
MRLHVAGEWPGPIVLRRGLSLARARPWNDDASDVSVRLARGTAAFLAAAAGTLAEMTGGGVFSPALYPTATTVWGDAGFREHVRLDIMERRLDGGYGEQQHPIRPAVDSDEAAITEIDERTFEGFWRIGELGIQEALTATSRSIMLVADAGSEVAGYAVVGAQFGRSFLQRIAVAPEHQGAGYGRSLLARSMEWASERGTGTMVLNLRTENEHARGFYERAGFVASGEHLTVLRFD